jgi:hypothetical protein
MYSQKEHKKLIQAEQLNKLKLTPLTQTANNVKRAGLMLLFFIPFYIKLIALFFFLILLT